VCSNISGTVNPRYIPEEIFYADIEPTLNSTSEVEYLAFKSFYNRWFPPGIFPHDHFHNIDGEWVDHNLNHISFEELCSCAKEIDYPVVMKPIRGHYGGDGVVFPSDEVALVNMIRNRKNIVIQEKIKQHPFFNQFHENSINTVRVHVYRSVSDNKLHILNAALRFGINNMELDNVSSGGLATFIRDDGTLAGFAIDRSGMKYHKNPNNGSEFNYSLPDIAGLKELALTVAHKVFFARIMGLDMCYDINSKWKVIEMNLFGGTIRASQYFGYEFFGNFSDEVFNYCKNNHWTLV
jgi:hypothetical protein